MPQPLIDRRIQRCFGFFHITVSGQRDAIVPVILRVFAAAGQRFPVETDGLAVIILFKVTVGNHIKDISFFFLFPLQHTGIFLIIQKVHSGRDNGIIIIPVGQFLQLLIFFLKTLLIQLTPAEKQTDHTGQNKQNTSGIDHLFPGFQIFIIRIPAADVQQIPQQLRSALVTLRRIDLHHLIDDAKKPAAKRQAAPRQQRLSCHPVHHRRIAGNHMIETGSQTVDIRPVIHHNRPGIPPCAQHLAAVNLLRRSITLTVAGHTSHAAVTEGNVKINQTDVAV